MPKMVDVPGYDQPVEFPDSMSNEDISKVLQKQTKKEKAPLSSGSRVVASHFQDPSGRALKAPEIDPLTGRQKTAGRTMTEEETAKYRTASMAMAGATVGSMGLGAAAAPVAAGVGAMGTFAIQAGARLFGAALGGAGGEAYGQLFEHAHGVGPSSSGAAASRIGESAKDQAELEGLGLGFEGASKLVAGGLKAGGSRLYSALSKTTVGQNMQAAKAAAATERNLVVSKKAAETADEIANSFLSKPFPGILEVRGPGIIKAVEEKVNKNVKTMYKGFKKAVSDKIIDYRDVAHVIDGIEKETPRAKGGLSVMTEPDPDWTKFVEAMREGNKPTLIPPPAGAKTGYTTVVRNAVEAAPAVVDARGTISQRIADLEKTANAPSEYVEGLKKSLSMIDAKLEAAASEVGPGGPELLKAAKQYFGASREIQKQTMYKLMKDGGDVAHALMDKGAPEGVAVLKAVARETRDATIVPTAQRAVIEKLLNPSGKGTDLLRFNDRLSALGHTGEHLFSDPRASRVIVGLKEQADVLNHLETVPRINGKGAEKMAIELFTHATGYVGGYAIGQDLTGNWHGGMAGGVLGGAYANKLTASMLRLAENPAANRMFLGALKTMEKTGEVSGPAIAQAARAIRMVKKATPIGEGQDASQEK